MAGLSGDGDRLIEINVLNGVQKFYAITKRALESFAATNQPHAASALIDHGCRNSFRHIILSGSAATVDQANSSHIAVGNLIAAEIDWMIRGEFIVHTLIE